MKKLLILSLLFLPFMGCQPSGSDAANTTETTESGQTVRPTAYGHALTTAAEAKSAAEVPDLLQQQDSVYLTLSGKALTSCEKKGCWMTVALTEGKDMRVTFKDYGFFVPKDLKGEKVVMEGILKRKVSSIEELRHYAEDAGKTAAEIQAIQQPDTAYAFEAVGVLVYPFVQK
ncbi:MAG: DUF4920 domain-containing protein [Bacteroidetes bacterium]|nr:DUF4920 domain-containing protein [Bacteroidota bacterium]